MVNYNGELLSDATDFFNHTNRGFRFGDALFEEVRVIHEQPIFLEAHYFRFMAAMRMLRMEIPMNFTMEYLEQELLRTIRANAWETSPVLARITFFRKGGTELAAVSDDVAFLITGSVLNSPFYTLSSSPYPVELYKDFYVNADMLSNLDSCNKLLNTLASIYAKENGYADCLLINGNKNVVASIYGNLFLVSGNEIKTPPLQDGCTNSVIRKELMAIIQASDPFELREDSISPFELQKADELFVVNVKDGILPITKYRKKEYSTTVAGNLLGKLNAKARLSN